MRSFGAFVTVAGIILVACSGPADVDPSNAGPESSSATTTTRPPQDTRTPAPSPSATPSPSPSATPSPSLPATLPSGARTILSEHRLVGFAGGRSPAFGRLAIDDLDAAAARLDRITGRYRPDGRTILPVFELITVVAHDTPGDDGMYRTREPDHVIRTYLEAAREHGALLLLNIQPGRADFLDELKRLEPWLTQPDVGVALDPEWAVDGDEVPGDVYGSTTGAELDAAARYLSSLVAEHNLPEKVMVFHQVHTSVVREEGRLRPRPGIVPIKSVDGIGARADKEKTWRTLMSRTTADVHAGFKLFFDEDTESGPLMTPAQVLALTPAPVYVMYE